MENTEIISILNYLLKTDHKFFHYEEELYTIWKILLSDKEKIDFENFLYCYPFYYCWYSIKKSDVYI